MSNWILAQQIILSMILIVMLIAERKGVTFLGAKGIYSLWILVPLVLMANNIPSNLLPINNMALYQYVVKVNQTSYVAGSILSWQILWFLGAAGVLLIALKAQWQIYRGQHCSVDPSQLPVNLPKHLKVVESNLINAPLIAGIWPSTLILPDDFQSRFTVQQQRLILQHELVHFRRLDNLCNLVALVFVAVFWFNPLIWLAYSAFRNSQELACDAAVLNNRSQLDKINYSKALLLCTQASGPHLSVYSQYGAKHPMLLRIQRIKNQTVIKKRNLLIAAIGGLGLLTTVAMANQQGKVVDSAKVNEATPILRVEPKYPIEAAQQKIEGSVVLQFDITEDGSTSNIKIIKAEPQNVFTKNSIAALQKWQYKPQIIGGQAQIQHNLLVQLDYRLGENPSPIRPLIETVKILQ
jgi:bla regulator protein blaR1